MALDIFKLELLFIALHLLDATSLLELRDKEFHLNTNPTRGPKRLSGASQSSSLISCIVNCLSRFPDDCQSVIYNSQTQLCTPGQWLESSEPKLGQDEGDLFTSFQCNPSQGFSLSTYGNTQACVSYQTTARNYTDARYYCESIDSYLYIITNMDKYYLLQNLFQQGLWLGLNDMETEGVYVWSDGSVNNMSSTSEMFLDSEPNDFLGGEDCIGMLLPLPGKLNDDSCFKTFHSVCERTL